MEHNSRGCHLTDEAAIALGRGKGSKKPGIVKEKVVGVECSGSGGRSYVDNDASVGRGPTIGRRKEKEGVAEEERERKLLLGEEMQKNLLLREKRAKDLLLQVEIHEGLMEW